METLRPVLPLPQLGRLLQVGAGQVHDGPRPLASSGVHPGRPAQDAEDEARQDEVCAQQAGYCELTGFYFVLGQIEQMFSLLML